VIDRIEPDRLVFLDEMGVSLAMHTIYGWGKKGQPLNVKSQVKRGKNLSVLGAMGTQGMICVDEKLGAYKREDMESYLSEKLLPCLKAGRVIVMDNASIHKGGDIARLIKEAGCELLYLPGYSPDFNPIELVWGLMKRAIRRDGPRTDADRERSVSEARQGIDGAVAAACFRHCSYIPSF
jgi:transposase